KMEIKIKKGKGVTILDVEHSTQYPVDATLTSLNGNGISTSYVYINFTGLKPTRFNSGDLEKLFTGLPTEKITYILGLPPQMLSDAESALGICRRNSEKYLDCIIADKKSAIRMVNQRNR
ncbi:MAG: hypothetical protein Q8O84_02230, partial [Nanoarchaeota archaeon]|nr:hypothetical protein [Nanoarchaeota archaeon]